MQTASEPDEDASFEPEADSESVLWQPKQTKLVANGAFCAEDVTRLLSQVRAYLSAFSSQPPLNLTARHLIAVDSRTGFQRGGMMQF